MVSGHIIQWAGMSALGVWVRDTFATSLSGLQSWAMWAQPYWQGRDRRQSVLGTSAGWSWAGKSDPLISRSVWIAGSHHVSTSWLHVSSCLSIGECVEPALHFKEKKKKRRKKILIHFCIALHFDFALTTRTRILPHAFYQNDTL